MTTGFALDYIPRRMCELGHGSQYIMRYRHIVLKPKETKTINAPNQLFLLVDPCGDLRIESTGGLYDQSEDQVNELNYEHRGEIVITNQSIFISHVRFIQVIPQICKKPCP